jgi:hypothetical protein
MARRIAMAEPISAARSGKHINGSALFGNAPTLAAQFAVS